MEYNILGRNCKGDCIALYSVVEGIDAYYKNIEENLEIQYTI